MINAKQQVITFLKTAPREKDRCFTFTLENTNETQAKEYIHRMRVELSRLRANLRDRGKQLRAFKMLLEDMKAENGNVIVTLRFAESVSERMSKDLSSIFNVISTGDNIVNEREARGLKEPTKQAHNPMERLHIHVKAQ